MVSNPFIEARKIKKPLILDGAMGSLLQQRGVKSSGKSWSASANLKNPEIVIEIHKEYINSGVDIITTNTFRTNPAALKDTGFDGKKLVRRAVQNAKTAADGKNILIAGSNAPAEDCYQTERTLTKKELEFNHKIHIDLLMENGVDFILNETQSHFDEIKIIADYCSKNSIPFVLSLFTVDGYNLLSNNKLSDVVGFILSFNPLAISFNCIRPETFEKTVREIDLNFPWGFYLNLGLGNFNDEIITQTLNEKKYIEIIKNYLDEDPSFIGACCGSSPAHIKKLSRLIKGSKISE